MTKLNCEGFSNSMSSAVLKTACLSNPCHLTDFFAQTYNIYDDPCKERTLCKVLSSPNYHIPQSFCCEAFIHPVKSINNNTIHTHNTQPTGGKFPTLPVLCTARNHHRSQGVSKGLIGGFERPPIGDTTHCSVHAIISQRWWLNHPI